MAGDDITPDPTSPDPTPVDERRARATLGRAGRVGMQRLSGSVRSLFATGGRGFRNLALTQVFSTSTDTLVAVGLAGTLFFDVPSAEARGNVAIYLLLTVAPFAVIGPTLGRILDRAPRATRAMLVTAGIGRTILAVALLGRLDSLWLFPLAFGLLVLSRVHGITRNALLPIALDAPRALVAANARLAWISVLAGVLVAPIGVASTWVLDSSGPLVLAAVSGIGVAVVGMRLPDPAGEAVTRHRGERRPRLHLPREVRLAQLATAGVRLLNGFLLLLLAFAFRDAEAGLIDFAFLLAAGGVGFAFASRLVPVLERRIREEPMVVAALSLVAGAAFSSGLWFGLLAATALAFAAGIGWGTAKLAFDGLLQSTVPATRRGAAFTRSETMFSIAWVLGAIVPTATPIAPELGLALAGFAALAAQIVYVGAILVPPGERAAARRKTREPAPDEPADVNDT